jgi:hypothetical protein
MTSLLKTLLPAALFLQNPSVWKSPNLQMFSSLTFNRPWWNLCCARPCWKPCAGLPIIHRVKLICASRSIPKGMNMSVTRQADTRQPFWKWSWKNAEVAYGKAPQGNSAGHCSCNRDEKVLYFLRFQDWLIYLSLYLTFNKTDKINIT